MSPKAEAVTGTMRKNGLTRNRRYSNVGKVRKAQGVKQENLARSVGISRAALSDIERGAYLPRIDVALDLSAALMYPVESLFPPRSGNR